MLLRKRIKRTLRMTRDLGQDSAFVPKGPFSPRHNSLNVFGYLSPRVRVRVIIVIGSYEQQETPESNEKQENRDHALKEKSSSPPPHRLSLP
jgi:hypothetical protein